MVATRRRLVLGLALIGSVVLAGGCLSPTLPLPPPSEPEQAGPDEQGEVELTGWVLPRSEVMALNTRTYDIRGQYTPDGWYSFRLPARVGDELSLFYAQGDMMSPSIVVVVRGSQQ